MKTSIHVTNKLLKTVKKHVPAVNDNELSFLGKWNATVFYVDRKKCLLFTNKITAYNLIIPDFRTSELTAIKEIFIGTFYEQTNFDGIEVEYIRVSQLVGELEFLRTDNDKRTTGFQNQRLYELDYWKSQYDLLDDPVVKDLTNRMNKTPIYYNGKKMSDLSTPIVELTSILSNGKNGVQ